MAVPLLTTSQRDLPSGGGSGGIGSVGGCESVGLLEFAKAVWPSCLDARPTGDHQRVETSPPSRLVDLVEDTLRQALRGFPFSSCESYLRGCE